MTPDVKRRLHFWYGICLAVLTVIVGILFISQAADIYYSGEGYSRELVIERCTAIAAPFWIWIAAIVAGGIIWMIYPAEKKKLKRLPDARGDVERFYKLAAKQSDKEGFDEAAKAVARVRKIRRIVWISCMTVCLICAGVGLYYLFNLPEYPSDPNEAVLRLVRTTLICVIVAFIACCGATVFDTISAKKILPKARQMLALAGKSTNSQGESQKNDFTCKVLSITKVILIILSAVGIILTIYVSFYVDQKIYEDNNSLLIFNNVILPFVPIIFLLFASSDLEDMKQFTHIKTINIISLTAKIMLVVFAIVYIIIGVLNGGMADVLGKAINICTECIGLG